MLLLFSLYSCVRNHIYDYNHNVSKSKIFHGPPHFIKMIESNFIDVANIFNRLSVVIQPVLATAEPRLSTVYWWLSMLSNSSFETIFKFKLFVSHLMVDGL